MIQKKYLLLIAGLVWMLAGSMVIKTGISSFSMSPAWPYQLLGAVITFCLFYLFIFSKMVGKHEKRINSSSSERLPFWQFFDLKSYLIMIFMMAGGISLRHFHLVPNSFIAFFYPGLGFALFSAGTRFISRFIRNRS